MKKIKHARAEENGIIFYSNQYPSIGFKTFMDESGVIKYLTTTSLLQEYVEHLKITKKKKRFSQWVTVSFHIVLFLITSILSWLTQNFGWSVAAIFFIIFVSSELSGIISIMKRSEERKYHGAEHMAANAYEKLQRIPSLKEIKNFSRFAKECGSREGFLKMVAFTLISMECIFLWQKHPIIWIFSAIITFYICQYATKKGWLRFLQVFVTQKPSEKELIVAIEGLKFF